MGAFLATLLILYVMNNVMSPIIEHLSQVHG